MNKCSQREDETNKTENKNVSVMNAVKQVLHASYTGASASPLHA